MKTLYKRVLILVVCLFLIGSILPAIITLPVLTEDYEQTTLTVTDCSGGERSTFTVDIAETASQKYVGLSQHNDLQSGEGMLFTYNSTGERSFVMRNMDFPIAIVFIDSERTVTDIKLVEQPAGPIEYYLTYERVTGTGMSVLEIPIDDADKFSVGSCVDWD